MKKIVFIALVALSISTAYAKDKGPKIELNDDTVLVDKKPVFILETQNKKKGALTDYAVKDLNGTKLLYLTINFYSYNFGYNASGAPSFNTVTYFEVTFSDSEQKAEFKHYRQPKLAEFLVDSGLIESGKIAKDKEEEFILENGTEFSEIRKLRKQ
jgi:hypothetical protein